MKQQIDLIQVAVEIQNINKYCQEPYSEKNGDLLSERITKLNIYLSRSSELVAMAESFLNEKIGELANKWHEKDPELAPTKFKQLIAGEVANETKVWRYAERTNRTITHQLETLRSQLSYAKEQSREEGYAKQLTALTKEMNEIKRQLNKINYGTN